MKVIPLAAESLGVRSMATYVECGETRVLIDPGAMLAPNRFNLAPVEEEWEALRRANDRISAYATRASLVFVSHYHEDHFRHDPGFYAGRQLWAKDATRHIEGRQAQRAATLWRTLKGHAEPVAAEGRRLETADAVLQASPPLGHGSDGTALGYVVALTVEDRREGTRFVHASDVQGPLSPVAAAYLARQRPTHRAPVADHRSDRLSRDLRSLRAAGRRVPGALSATVGDWARGHRGGLPGGARRAARPGARSAA